MPRIVDPEQRRREIVDACWQSVVADGIEGATMRRIAELAGCSTGRLTHYFADREAILVAALETVHEQAGARMLAVTRRRHGLAALRAVLLEALPLDEVRTREWSVWLAFWGRAAVDDRLRAEHERRYAEWRALLRRTLRQAVTAGDIGAVDLAVETDRLVVLVDGLALQGVLGTIPPRRLRRLVDAHLTTLPAA